MLKRSRGQPLLSVVRRLARFSFAHERRIAASTNIGVLSSPFTCPARRLTSITPPPSAETSVCDLVARYTRAEYPQVPIWSLADLEPSPPRQKSLRRHLEIQRVNDLQFLRWRNASLPCAGFPAAIGYLSYALLPTSSVFDRHENRIAGAQSWDLTTPLNDENCAKIADKTPFWVIERLFKQQLLSPKYISAAVNLLRQYPAGQNRNAFIHIILSCIADHVHSVLPRLLKALRDDDGVSSEAFAMILRALVSGPLVPTSMPALPDRSVRNRVSHSKRPNPGPRTSLVTFATHNEMCLILCHMVANGMKLDGVTYMHLASARPALPSSLMRILNDNGVGSSPPTERKLIALARSFASEGRSFETGRVLDRLRKYRIMCSPAVVPVSAAFDKRLSSDPTLLQLPQKFNVDYGRLNSPATGREAVTRLNAMFLHAFHNDRRSRDPARLPHAAMSYFRRLQLHSERSIGARASLSPSALQGSDSRGMMTAWNSFITCMASQRGFPPEKLLHIIDAVSKASASRMSPLTLQVPTITACILGLVRRAEYNAALQVWTRFVANDIASASALEPLDWAAVIAGGRALSESGHLAEAFRLLNDVISKNRVSPLTNQSALQDTTKAARRSGDVVFRSRMKFVTEDSAVFRDQSASAVEFETRVRDTDSIPTPAAASARPLVTATAVQDVQGVLRFLTSFMRTLAHRGRPDVVYMLWDSMQQLYGVRPNDYTLNMLLVTASSFSTPFKAVSLSQQMGWRARASRHGGTKIDTSDRIANIMDTLRDPMRFTKDVGFWWGDRPAWQTARQIFREVILGNWPELALLPPPAVAHPEGFHPLIGLPRLRLAHPKPSSPPNSPTPQSSAISTNTTSLARIPRVTVGKYYDIIPTQRSFDAYIRLLCEHGLEAEIPEALLWQRELGILPSHRSLRIALMHFSAVGTSAPFDEAVLLKRGEAGSPYGKLKDWIRDWVPKGYMPTENEIEKERILWGASREHWARKRLAKDQEKRRAKWRRSRKDLRRKGPRSSWKEQTSAAMTEKRRADLSGSEATSHEARVIIW